MLQPKSTKVFRPIANLDPKPGQKAGISPLDEQPLLDAYSQAIIRAVNKVSPAVVNIDVRRQVKAPGRVRRSYIGLGGQNVALPRRLVRRLRLPTAGGVLAITLEPQSPARKAGLRQGDVIVAFDGQPISEIDDLHKLLTEGKIGVKSSLTILRGVDKMDLEILPEESKSRPRSPRVQPTGD